jgi:hypothetical protein
MTPEQTEAILLEWREYHAAVGKLVLKWAHVEWILYSVLLHYGRISDSVGRAVLSGTRASTMIEFMRALMSNIKMTARRKSDLEFVFAQMNTINFVRDKIVHYGHPAFRFAPTAGPKAFEQMITNAKRASRGEANTLTIPVSTKSLELMLMDLETITQHLCRHFLVKGPFRPFRYHQNEPTTWLYKSPQPVKKDHKSHATHHKWPNQR